MWSTLGRKHFTSRTVQCQCEQQPTLVTAESREVLGVGYGERDLPVLVAGAVVTPLTGGKTNCVPLHLVKP